MSSSSSTRVGSSGPELSGKALQKALKAQEQVYQVLGVDYEEAEQAYHRACEKVTHTTSALLDYKTQVELWERGDQSSVKMLLNKSKVIAKLDAALGQLVVTRVAYARARDQYFEADEKLIEYERQVEKEAMARQKKSLEESNAKSTQEGKVKGKGKPAGILGRWLDDTDSDEAPDQDESDVSSLSADESGSLGTLSDLSA